MVFAGPPEDDIDWADLSPAGSLRFALLDVASLASLAAFAATVTEPVGVLVNAGVMALPRREHTADGFERQLGLCL